MASQQELIRAIDAAVAGHWDEAHGIVQKLEDDARANHIHAVLHIQEGDESNAMYWFRRAGIQNKPDADPEQQLLKLREELLESG